METPLKLINQRLKEVTLQLKNALNNNLANDDINKLCRIYNDYFIAFQILQNHTEINHKFSRLYVNPKGKIIYGEVYAVHHKNGLMSYKSAKKNK